MLVMLVLSPVADAEAMFVRFLLVCVLCLYVCLLCLLPGITAQLPCKISIVLTQGPCRAIVRERNHV